MANRNFLSHPSAVSSGSVASGVMAFILCLASLGGSARAQALAFQSDDFSAPALNTSLWTFVNPKGDGTLAMTGTQASLAVPAGIVHQAWIGVNDAPRLMQPAANTDFELEVKFESSVTQKYQIQGVLIEQSPDTFLRIECYSVGNGAKIYAGAITGSSAATRLSKSIANGGPGYLRVNRTGNTWRISYSYTGTSWTVAGSFTQALTVTRVGPYVANEGNPAPAHTAVVDYFFNTAAPIVPEDGGNPSPVSLTVNVVGSGSVTRTPNKATYDPGEVVQLEAIPGGPSWAFQGWSGDLTGNANPTSITMAQNKSVTATFIQDAATTITPWYGDVQSFGTSGLGQQWVDVLGTATDGDGIASLSYSLNGGPEKSMAIGPDNRRLVAAGDFNAQIPIANMNEGMNTVRISVIDNRNQTTRRTVAVIFHNGTFLPDTCNIDWGLVSNIQDVAQVVDGTWTVSAQGLRNTAAKYDRLVTIGDLAWGDFEITVPITVHDYNPEGFTGINTAPGAGMILRWTGHTDDPVVCWQPRCGWQPHGNSVWYRWGPSGGTADAFSGGTLKDPTGRVLQFNTTYIYKVRVETPAGQATRYKFKIWQQGQTEPAGWTVEGGGAYNVPNGSIMLVSHFTHVTVGNVAVKLLKGAPISQLSVQPSNTSAVVTWRTDRQATGVVNWGLTSTYEMGHLENPALTLDHAFTIPGLSPNTTYHFQVRSTDSSGNTSASDDGTFTTLTPNPDPIQSDDFSAPALNSQIWTVNNPLGDAAISMTGSQVSLNVPAGSVHNGIVGSNTSLRLTQPAPNTDFEVEAKFDSVPRQTYQFQGIVAEQDASNYLRVDYVGVGGLTRLMVVQMKPASAVTLANIAVGSTDPLYLRLRRSGNTWTTSYSSNGTTWQVAKTFTLALNISRVGVITGNDGPAPPAYTALVDYFFNTASPIVPEN